MPNGTPTKGQTPAEAGAMISAIGLVISIAVVLVNFVRNGIADGLWEWSRLAAGLLFMCGPWLVAFAISAYFIRRKKDTSQP